MLAILGFIAFVIAGFLHFTGGHGSATLWFIIIGGLLATAEMAWGVHRSGWYGRRAA
jgi:hypothetical protein